MREHTKDAIARLATKTDSVVVQEWDDPPQEGRSKEDFPYPNHYKKTEVHGPMADAIRAKVGAPGYNWEIHKVDPVYLIEIEVSDGYSEYTQENYTYIRVECIGKTFEFGDREMSSNAFAKLMNWLEDDAQTV